MTEILGLSVKEQDADGVFVVAVMTTKGDWVKVVDFVQTGHVNIVLSQVDIGSAIAAASKAVGPLVCPVCFGEIVAKERSPDGFSTCVNRHRTRHSALVPKP